ncbi:MAG: hypothetical protein QN229_02745 [Desulfurococcaceae archaeon TW002]
MSLSFDGSSAPYPGHTNSTSFISQFFISYSSVMFVSSTLCLYSSFIVVFWVARYSVPSIIILFASIVRYVDYLGST